MAAQTNDTSFKLKYLFLVEFEDGTNFKQTEDDVSKTDPKRSQFYDVLQTGKKIKKFSLVGPETITVDLEGGLFIVNGLEVLAEGDKLPGIPDKFDLIFYRQHTHNMNVNYEVKTGKENDAKMTDHLIEYFIGWECEIGKKKYKQKLAVV